MAVNWQVVPNKPYEMRAEDKGRILYMWISPEHHWCFCDGLYLGQRKTMEEGKKLAESGKRDDIVMADTTPDTRQQYKEFTGKKPKLAWTPDKDKPKEQWHADPVEGERVGSRIRMVDKDFYTCYRCGKYLGMERTLEEAKLRCVMGVVSERTRIQLLWEQKNPGLLPPYLDLTPSEQEEYFRLYPPRKKAAPPPPAEGAKRVRDPSPAARERPAGGGSAEARANAKVMAEAGIAAGGTIKRLRDDAPARPPGSKAEANWNMVFAHAGKTVDEFVKAGGNAATLRNAIKAGYVEITP